MRSVGTAGDGIAGRVRLTEEELLAKPFYTVATPEPDLRAATSNYRTLLIDLLMQIRIKSPSSLHNITVGELLVTMDWKKQAPTIQRLLERGEHNSLCLAHGRRPLIPYQPTSYPEYKVLEPEKRSCKQGFRPRQSLLHSGYKPGPRPLTSAQTCLSAYIVFVTSYSIFFLLFTMF